MGNRASDDYNYRAREEMRDYYKEQDDLAARDAEIRRQEDAARAERDAKRRRAESDADSAKATPYRGGAESIVPVATAAAAAIYEYRRQRAAGPRKRYFNPVGLIPWFIGGLLYASIIGVVTRTLFHSGVASSLGGASVMACVIGAALGYGAFRLLCYR